MTALEPAHGELELRAAYLPLDPVEAKQAMAAYQELCGAVLTAEDWIGRPGESDSFVKKSGWITLATFYGASVELVGDTLLERDADGKLQRAESKARATSRDGRVFEGRGACGANEPRFANARGRQKIEHDLPATADTRATNRAIASLIGFGAVSAEEIDADVRAGAPDLPAWAADIPDDAIDRVGDYLATILRAVGHPEPEREALAIGSAIHEHCGRFPDACARLTRLLEQAVPRPAADDDDLPWAEANEADENADSTIPGASDDVATEADEADDAHRPTEGTAP